MRQQSPGPTGPDAARRAGERVALFGGAAAVNDASARLAGRAGVAATGEKAARVRADLSVPGSTVAPLR